MSRLAVVAIILYVVWLLGFFVLKSGTNRELAQLWEASLYVTPILVITGLTVGAWIEGKLIARAKAKASASPSALRGPRPSVPDGQPVP